MSKTVFVSLEVVVDDDVKADVIAEAMFDHACTIEDGRIDHISGYDFNVRSDE